MPGIEERVDVLEERYDKRVDRIREAARRQVARLRRDEKSKVASLRRGATDLSENGAEFIASWEGFVDHPYKPLPSETYWTWGYGHYGQDVPTPDGRGGPKIARAQALKVLAQDAGVAEAAVRSGVEVRLTQNQFDALVSFVFNVGTGAFAGSTLRAVLNAGRYAAVPGELMRWVNAGGHPVQGLVNRRRAEADLFTK